MDDEGFEDWPALLNSRNAWYGHNWPGYPTLQPWVPTARPPQEKYTFVRNPYFYKVDAEGNQLPYLNNLVMLATDRDLLALKCTTGDANLQSRGLAFADITLLKENEEQGGYQTRLWRSDSAAFLRIMPNYCVQDEVLQELFLDRRFRIALSHALNRQEMNDVLFLGYGVPQQVELLPGVPGYNEEFAQAYTAYDPAEANRLLDEMGLTERDSDGYRLRPDGKTLDLIFEDAGENSAYPDAIELITDYYKAIGIKVIYKVSERATYRDRMESGEAPVGMWGSELGLDYRWGEGIVHITGNTDGTNCWGEWYESDGELGTEPPDSYLTMQELASEWLTTYDPDETDQIRDQIRAINAEELYQVGTVAGLPAPVVVADGMRNVPEEGFSLWSRGGYFYWAEPYQFWVEE
jgi:peptide/nickel transport system substrate-binding protein